MSEKNENGGASRKPFSNLAEKVDDDPERRARVEEHKRAMLEEQERESDDRSATKMWANYGAIRTSRPNSR